MFNVKYFCLILALLFSNPAKGQFVEEGTSNIATSADALYPVTDGNNVTFYRLVGGVREAAFVISANGDNKIDIRGHANVKSLYLNGFRLFDENGIYKGKPFSGHNLKDNSIKKGHISIGAVESKHIVPKAIDKTRLKPFEIFNVINSSTVGISYSYCPTGSILMTGGCETKSNKTFQASRPVYDKSISGWSCITAISTYIKSYATCLKGLPSIKKTFAPL